MDALRSYQLAQTQKHSLIFFYQEYCEYRCLEITCYASPKNAVHFFTWNTIF